MDEVVEAARKANIHNFVESLPEVSYLFGSCKYVEISMKKTISENNFANGYSFVLTCGNSRTEAELINCECTINKCTIKCSPKSVDILRSRRY